MHLHFSGDWLDLIMGYENSSLVTGALNNPKTAALRFDAFQEQKQFAILRPNRSRWSLENVTSCSDST